jgi:DNA-binding transcriptional regulator YhcF (GntR family)
MIFHTERPIYAQLMDEIRGNIAAGRLAPGTKMHSIRELAGFYAVNPNTVQRALSELEREGLVYTRRASGKMVTENAEMIRELRAKLAANRIHELLTMLAALGFTLEETRALFEQAEKTWPGEPLTDEKAAENTTTIAQGGVS